MAGIAPGLDGFLAQRQFANQENMQGLQQIQGILGIQQAQQQQGILAQKLQDQQRQRGLIEQYAQSLPESERPAFMVDPAGYMKAKSTPYTLAPGAVRYGADNKPLASAPVKPMNSSDLSRLISERDALPPDSPLRQTYDNAIRKQSETAKQISPTIVMPKPDKVPMGYRATPDGGLEPIPGGPADMKLQGAFNQDTAALTGSTNAMDRLATAANETMNHPGLAGITGLRGALPNIPGSAAADAQAKLNTLKSQVAFGVLQDMRNNSKTGGALGSVSDAEGKRLEANLAALENAQSVDQMKDSLKKIIEYTSGAKDRLQGAYNLKHQSRRAGDQKPSASGEWAIVK